MDNPLEAQKAIYGENDGDGPPMLFTPEKSDIFKDQASWNPPRRASSKRRIKQEEQKQQQGKQQKQKSNDDKAMELYRQIKNYKNHLATNNNNMPLNVSACELPSDFPKDLVYRSMAAYALLRTLSVQLRLSPFSANVFLRALYLPIPNKLMGDIHVSILRILLPQLQMGYSYKEQGGGVGIHKRRQIDNIRWTLRGGDNLTHLDSYSWPLFYDDYCHLTADKLWTKYQGNPEDTTGNSRYIDFRTIGLVNEDEYYEPAEYSSRPSRFTTRTSNNDRTNYNEQSDDEGNNDDEDDDDNEDEPVTAKGGRQQSGTKRKADTKKPIKSKVTDVTYPDMDPDGIITRDVEKNDELSNKNSDMEDYELSDNNDDDDDEDWGRQTKKKRRRTNTSATPRPMDLLSSTPNREVSNQHPSPATPGSKIISIEYPMSQTFSTSSSPSKQQSAPADTDSHTDIAYTSKNASQTIASQSSTPHDASEPAAPDTKQDASISNSQEDDTVARIRGGGMPGENGVAHNLGRSRRGLPMHNRPGPSNINDNRPFQQPNPGNGYGGGMGAGMIPPNFAYLQQQQQQHQQMLYQMMQQQQRLQQMQGQRAQLMNNFQFSRTGYAPSASQNAFHGSHTYGRNELYENSRPLVVPDDLANKLKAFLSNTGQRENKELSTEERVNSESPTVETDNDDEGSNYEDPFESTLLEDQWSHFEPLKVMRAGVPYHRLCMENKLKTLEFLIDELLSIDAIAAEFSARHDANDSFGPPYGTLPTDEDLEKLENEDECGICRQEGDLLCCDGCVSSYHRACLDMEPEQELPDGKWLCPECLLFDPCMYGPLYSGRKSCLDWFSSNDLNLPDNVSVPEVASDGNPLANDASTKTDQDGDVPSSTSPPVVTSAETTSNAMTNTETTDWNKMEFLVVHGFLFCRERSRELTKKEKSDLLSSNPYVSLSKKELDTVLSKVDARLSSSWPLCQIPASDLYLQKIDTMNPCSYNNRYKRAPVTALTKAGGIHQVARLMQMDYEKECSPPCTIRMSDVLMKDTSLDANIAYNLKMSRVIYDPFQLCIKYLVRLEQTLRKACMINPFWDGGKIVSNSENWLSSVKSSKSIHSLGRLLLKLVDDIHPRAFSEAWFSNSHAKSPDTNVLMPERNFANLPDDWTIEKEKTRRRWETTPVNMILGLCTDDGSDLKGFAAEIRSDIYIAKPTNAVKSKRKAKQKIQENPSVVQVDDSKPVATTESIENRKDGSPKEIILEPGAQTDHQKDDADIGSSNVEMDSAKKAENPIIPTNEDCANVPKKCDSEVEFTDATAGDTAKMELEAAEEGPRAKADNDLNTLQNIDIKDEESNNTPLPETVNGDSGVASDTPKMDLEAAEEGPRIKGNDDLVTPQKVDIKDGQSSNTPVPETVNGETVNGDSGVASDTPKMDLEAAEEGPRTEGNDDFVTPQKVDDIKDGQSNNTPVQETVNGDSGIANGSSMGNSQSDADDVKMDLSEEKNCEEQPKQNHSDKDSGSSTKKKAKGKSNAPSRSRSSSRRNTRRSGRLASVLSPNETPVVTGSEPTGAAAPVEILDGMALQIENAKKMKIRGLEKLAKGHYSGEGIWPIAGRRIFPTEGNLSRTGKLFVVN